MIVDKQLEFSDSQAPTATAISTNVVDLTQGTANLTTIDIGTGEDTTLVIQVDTSVTSGTGGSTVTFSLESDSTADLATSPTVHWSSAAIVKTTLVAGYEVARIALPAGSYERYLGIRYTNSAALTAGAFSAFIVKDARGQVFYPKGFTVV